MAAPTQSFAVTPNRVTPNRVTPNRRTRRWWPALLIAPHLGCTPALAPGDRVPAVAVAAERPAPETPPPSPPTASALPTPVPTAPVEVPAAKGLGPVTIDTSLLPVMNYPRALLAADAPSQLNPGSAATDLEIRPSKLQKSGLPSKSRLSVRGADLTRLQVDDVIRTEGHAYRDLWLYCAKDIQAWKASGPPPARSTPPAPPLPGTLPLPFKPKPPQVSHAGVTPARWETLSRGPNGKTVLSITDAWFDHRTCQAAVEKVTTIEPQPIVEGLVYAFQGRCDDCKFPDVVTFVMPATTSQTTLGGAARGAFSILRMTTRPNTGTRFVGLADRYSLDRWDEALNGTKPQKDSTHRLLVSLNVEWHPKARTHQLVAFGSLLP